MLLPILHIVIILALRVVKSAILKAVSGSPFDPYNIPNTWIHNWFNDNPEIAIKETRVNFESNGRHPVFLLLSIVTCIMQF